MPVPEHGQPVAMSPGPPARSAPRPPSSRRRPKPALSCSLCRHRKLRCDRQQPCSACSTRGLGASCTYAPQAPPPRGAGAGVGVGVGNSGAPRSSSAAMQKKIQDLEKMVVDLMQQASAEGRQATPSSGPTTRVAATAACSDAPDDEAATAIDSPTPSSHCGSLVKAGAVYVNGAHWAAVLDGIAEIKDCLEKEDEEDEEDRRREEEEEQQQQQQQREQEQDEEMTVRASPQTGSPSRAGGRTGPLLLYSCHEPPTREEILASMPPRPVVDRLMSRYFNSFEMSPAVVHSVQFLREYEDFWENPAATSIVWVALLFTMMCLASQFKLCRLDPAARTPETAAARRQLRRDVDAYQQRVVQCLVRGDYVRGGPYVLETLVLYVAAEIVARRDAEPGIWLLCGTLVQTALRMGYHRDPRHVPHAAPTPFAAEMRRRVWATVVELDIGLSAQMGLPRLIRPWQTDTAEPAHLLDGDFDAATAALPPPRPWTTPSTMLYRIVKGRLVAAIGGIWDFAADTRPCRYADAVRLDRRLHAVHDAVPECLRWRSMARCLADPMPVMLQKAYLEILFHRARLVLHRRYLHLPPAAAPAAAPGTTATAYHRSRRECLDAALVLLEFQHLLQEETEPHGQLYQERWRVSSVLNHDFLLATSILCVCLQQLRGGSGGVLEGEDAEEAAATVERVRAALTRAHGIWQRSSRASKEARKAAKALSILLKGDVEGVRPEGEGDAPLGSGSDASPPGPLGDRPEDMAGFGVQLPAFDMAALADWNGASDEGGSSYQTPSAADDWKMTDVAMDTAHFLQWPWNWQ